MMFARNYNGGSELVEIVLAFLSEAENTISVLLGFLRNSVHVCAGKTSLCQHTVIGEV